MVFAPRKRTLLDQLAAAGLGALDSASLGAADELVGLVNADAGRDLRTAMLDAQRDEAGLFALGGVGGALIPLGGLFGAGSALLRVAGRGGRQAAKLRQMENARELRNATGKGQSLRQQLEWDHNAGRDKAKGLMDELGDAKADQKVGTWDGYNYREVERRRHAGREAEAAVRDDARALRTMGERNQRVAQWADRLEERLPPDMRDVSPPSGYKLPPPTPPRYDVRATKDGAEALHEGARVGSVTLKPRGLFDDSLEVLSMRVEPEHRRRGLANRMHDAIEAKSKKPIRPSSLLSSDGRAFYAARSPSVTPKPRGAPMEIDPRAVGFAVGAVPGAGIGIGAFEASRDPETMEGLRRATETVRAPIDYVGMAATQAAADMPTAAAQWLPDGMMRLELEQMRPAALDAQDAIIIDRLRRAGVPEREIAAMIADGSVRHDKEVRQAAFARQGRFTPLADRLRAHRQTME